MDSPETNKIVASTSSSPPVQDSPFFNYLSNLSPIKPAKVAHVARGLAELNFPPPPPVFTSPRVNPQPETNFVNRSQFPHSSNAELSFNCDNKGKTLTPSSDVSRPPVTRSMVGLISCSQKRHDSKGSVQVQPCSPSGFVDEYLADPVEGDSVNSPDLDDLCLNHTNDAPQVLQSGCMRSKETIMKLDDYVGDTRKDMETKMAAHNECSYGTSEKDNDLVMSNLSMESDSGVQKGQHFVVQVSTDSSSIISKTNERDIAGFDKKRAAFSESLCHHKLLDVKQQNTDGEQKGERECNPQSLPEHLQIVPAYESCDEDSGALSNELVENRMLFDYEDASQHQRGMLRRCLQFEAAEAHRNTIGSSCSFRNPKHIPNSKLPANPTESKIIDSSHMESSVTSSQKPPVHISQPTPFGLSLHPDKAPENYFDKIDRSVRNIGNTSITAPMPSGIGLHLNSVVNSTSMGCSAAPSMKLAQNDYSYSQIEKSPSLSKPHLPQESKSNSFPTSAAGKFSANNDDDLQESQAIVTESSAAFHSSHSPTTQINTLQLEVIEHHTTSSNKRKSESQNTDRLGFNEPSPKKKRKKESYTVTENEGCKRCNCRRSKCLKLYCDCFAAGIYCSEPCACQECFNKPEYEDMVLETRQQIESRNPLAFAPKIVRRVTESPVNSGDDDNRVTPSSARHKRGCNCKKSMCLKKYCECYQAGVGCSIGCRCEGCKNVFGIKEGYREITEMVYKRSDNGCWEDESEEQLDIFDTGSNFLHPEQCRAHNLSPLTPLFQFSSREKDVPKPRLPARQYLPSPESDDNNILTSYGKSPRPLRISNGHDMQEKKGEGNVEIVSYDLKLECSVAGTVVDQFSPRWDGLADLCNFTPLPHPPTSRVTSSSSSSSNNTRDRTQVSGVQLCRESVRLSSVGSLHWHSSPVTPMPHLGETKMPQEPDSESRYEILEDDDTPEILKDTPTPIRVVKVSSPNQKRVSPPHSRLHELRSNSSPGLRSGRKFVLQSISSFPPLTPYSDPKGDSNNK